MEINHNHSYHSYHSNLMVWEFNMEGFHFPQMYVFDTLTFPPLNNFTSTCGSHSVKWLLTLKVVFCSISLENVWFAIAMSMDTVMV